MNRKISICIIIVILVLLLVLIGIRYGRSSQEENPATEMPEVTEMETTIVANVNETVSYAYILRVVDKNLVVYLGDGQTVYMETGIKLEELSEELQKQAEQGIGFETEESLYDFLESYSS